MAPSWVKKLTPSGPQGSELLDHERAQSKIPVEKLAKFLFTEAVLSRQDRVLNVLKADKVFDKSQNYFDGREERFKTALARAKRLQQLSVLHQWSTEDYRMALELISEPGPYGLHASMFLVGCQSWKKRRFGALITSIDHPPRPGDAGAAQALSREGREI